MYSSIIVLSALVALAASAAFSHPLEEEHANSPMELAGEEAQPSKRQILTSWRSSWNTWQPAYSIYPGYSTYPLIYKKRDTAGAESQPDAPVSREHRDTNDSNSKDKRQVFYSGLGYSSYSAPIAYSAYPYSYSPLIFKRDTAGAESHPDAPVSRERRDTAAADDNNSKDKRQVYLPGYGYPYAPVAYSAYPYSYSPLIFKRDTAGAESHHDAPVSRERRDTAAADDSNSKDKRQVYLSGYGYPYAPIAYSAYPYSYSPLIFKRDTAGAESHHDAPVSRERRDTAAADDSNSKDKRQVYLSGYGYPYAPVAYSGYSYGYPLIYKK